MLNPYIFATIVSIGLAGCYSFSKTDQVDKVSVVKIESDLAPQFCSGLLGAAKRGCAVRMLNMDNGTVNCVVVILPNDGNAAAHEAGHCMGYDH